MIGKKHKLDDSFELTGNWWLPDKPDKKVPGVLRYDAGSIVLELIGNLHDDQSTFGVIDSVGLQPPLINGQCAGQFYCVYSCFLKTINTQFPSTDSTSKYGGRFLFAGVAFESEEDMKFVKLEVSFDSLEHWIGQLVFSVPDLANEEEFSRKYRHPEQLSIRCDSIASTVATDSRLETSGGYFEDKWTYTSSVIVAPDDDMDFHTACQRYADLRNLLTLCVGNRVFTKYFTLHYFPSKKQGDTDIPYQADVLFSERSRRLEKPVGHWEMLFHYQTIKEQFPALLNNWFSRSAELRTSYDLLFGTIYSDDLYVRLQFLNMIHAIENFDRHRNASHYLSKEEYEPIRQLLTNSIPPSVSKDHRRSLASKIEFGHEYSLRKRLAGLYASLSSECQQIVCRGDSSFPQKVADTRNYFSHYTKDLEAKAWTNPDQLFHATERLRFLLTILLLRDLGMEESLIANAIKNNVALQHFVNRVDVP
ncbi:MAG TPA: hypothetical protein PKD64_18410 [Pirellulaceae bacterium]|nr:hypothetical protein [Pirellulaceae bacterium]HMO94163.1 hypothetical protein [Pirellulaceae bacterium]